MAVLFTIDASIFVAAYRSHEGHSVDSREVLRLVKQAAITLIEPAILPVEITAALAHAGVNPTWAVEYAENALDFSFLTMQPLDETTARDAMKIAAQYRLRGADSLYVATAVRFGARLVTLDAEQLERSPASVAACKPDAAVALLRR